SEIDYRANVDALKRVGATDLVSVSACGSLREELAPGTFVLVDQFVDRTRARAASFFGTGCVAHVSMARPVCARLRDLLERAARGSRSRVAAPTSRWRGRSSRAARSPSSTAPGAAT